MAVSALVSGMLVWIFYPAVPRTPLGWVLLLLLGAPTWFALEWLGEAVTGAGVFKRLSSFWRIAVGVPVVLAFALLAGMVLWVGQWVITHV